MGNIKIRNFISISVIAFMIATVFALPVINEDYAVSAATKKVKVIYKANGGKFTVTKYASKSKIVKKVRKGKKRGTAPKIKRAGYTLKGWYTKKSGGKKVTAKTKIKKRTVLYAQWKRTLSASEKRLLAIWSSAKGDGNYYDSATGEYLFSGMTGALYHFRADGSYSRMIVANTATSKFESIQEGIWRESGGTIYKRNIRAKKSTDGGRTWSAWTNSADQIMKIQFGVENGSEYFQEVDGLKYFKGN